MSRGVAADDITVAMQRTIKQLCDWYRNDWQYYQVVCQYGDYCDSLCGIDDYEYAEGEVCNDLAHQVAGQMEDDGYTVTGKPQPPTDEEKRASRVAAFKQRLANNRKLGCWP